MKRIPVESSSIKSAGYEIKSNMLEVEFTSGAIYQYHDVPKRVYDELIEQKGKYLAANIKGIYKFSKV